MDEIFIYGGEWKRSLQVSSINFLRLFEFVLKRKYVQFNKNHEQKLSE